MPQWSLASATTRSENRVSRHQLEMSIQERQKTFNTQDQYLISPLPEKFLPVLREERTAASSGRLLNSVLGPPVAASPIGAFWAGFPFGVVDTLFVWTANNAVRNDNRFDSL